jgi:putative AlgH/UPF0301 family transcriptional regulator
MNHNNKGILYYIGGMVMNRRNGIHIGELSLWNRLNKVKEELDAGGLCEEEKDFLLQRADYLINELKVNYGVYTSI